MSDNIKFNKKQSLCQLSDIYSNHEIIYPHPYPSPKLGGGEMTEKQISDGLCPSDICFSSLYPPPERRRRMGGGNRGWVLGMAHNEY